LENSHKIKELFTKYLNKTISRDEYDALLNYFGQQDNEAKLDKLIADAMTEDLEVNDNTELNEIVDSVEVKLRQKLQPRRSLKLRKYIPYAAIIIAAILGGAYFLLHYHIPKQKVGLIADVNPGTSGATLTLATGKKIRLNAAGSTVTNDAGVTISNALGELVYKINESGKVSTGQVNILSTANGETYNIVLVDGTKVWLNAGSTLTYHPNLIESGKRVVKVAGEAYFEVSKNQKHPFIVKSNGQQIEVLGTHFNVNTYKGAANTITTLTEGAVKISTDRNTNFLKPGQQSITANGAITIETAELETALAWKDGKMYFKDAQLPEVMTEIARWYNVQVKYTGKPAKALFNGGFNRSAKLSEVLQILKASNVQCKLITENNMATVLVNTNQPYTP
jgi:transmembrane sensor